MRSTRSPVFVRVAVVATALVSTTIAVPHIAPLGAATAAAAEISARRWTTDEVLKGVLFLQGPFGHEVIRSGALGPLSRAQHAALEGAISSSDARGVAEAALPELTAAAPDVVHELMQALRGGNPVRTSAALKEVNEALLATPTMQRASTASSGEGGEGYVPGEDREGRAVLVVVVAGAVLVITVAAVGVGVVALVSTVAVGSTKVAGKNAVRKATGATARVQEAELTAAAIRVFHDR